MNSRVSLMSRLLRATQTAFLTALLATTVGGWGLVMYQIWFAVLDLKPAHFGLMLISGATLGLFYGLLKPPPIGAGGLRLWAFPVAVPVIVLFSVATGFIALFVIQLWGLPIASRSPDGTMTSSFWDVLSSRGRATIFTTWCALGSLMGSVYAYLFSLGLENSR